uniref:Tetratricopeptide repeat protein n=1 Tax=candidate division WOR-3 bacterium TaxID=2052148 RepID=A0A7V0Z4C7_UNCW3
MIILCLFFTEIDSLKNLIAIKLEYQYIIELNNAYLKSGLFDSANDCLKKYEERFGFEEQAGINYLLGENLFFKGELLSAREQYLKTVARFSSARYANEALERLYLFESARKDTILLKRLAKSIYLYEINELKPAEDSLKKLIKTGLGDFALFYLSLAYDKKNEFNQALSALEELKKEFPANRIHRAKILVAEVYIKMGKLQEGIKILEELVIKYPNSPIGIRAREILKKYQPPER